MSETEIIEWSKIINDFNDGISVNQLSKKYSLGYKKIDSYLINNNYKKVKHDKISDDKYNRILFLIKKGYNSSEIANATKSTPELIVQIANENNIKLIKGKRMRSNINRNFDDYYFHSIDTEEKAYFIGLIYADGLVRIHNGGYFLSLGLKSSDGYMVEKLANLLNCGNAIRKVKNITPFGKCESVTFETCNSKQIFDDLSRFDIIPNKTQKSTSFKNIKLIPVELRKHFLRGLIDGDGSISLRKKGNYYHTVSYIHPHKECCEYFDKLLKKLSNIDDLFDYMCYKDQSHLFNIRYKRINDVKRICEFLYKDSTIYLKRKYERARLYFDEQFYNDYINNIVSLTYNV